MSTVMKKNSASTIFFDKFCDLILCITAEYDLCGSIILEILHDVIVCLRKYTNNRTFFRKTMRHCTKLSKMYYLVFP